jgi:hypothetical protein
MDVAATLFLVGFLVVFGFLLYTAIQSSHKEKEGRQRTIQSLGFTPVDADAELTNKIVRLYKHPGSQSRYELRNVSRKELPDGSMYLIDLVDTSGDDDSIKERQAVAIVSPYLKLPQLAFFPKADQKYALSGLANKIVEWGMTKMGTPMAFADFPEFSERYVVTSNEPDLARGFLDDRVAQFFSRTQMYTVHAMGDVFTFSEMDPRFDTTDLNSMSQRINRAMDIFRVFQK